MPSPACARRGRRRRLYRRRRGTDAATPAPLMHDHANGTGPRPFRGRSAGPGGYVLLPYRTIALGVRGAKVIALAAGGCVTPACVAMTKVVAMRPIRLTIQEIASPGS